ncbi:hypothetical protein [Streptomyces sp. NPDC056682]|uniref:hypothetical protein n=1 Tax=Streptomyces sp. NPDC056682 TaxID=3345909 RepID=UPI0036B8B4C7
MGAMRSHRSVLALAAAALTTAGVAACDPVGGLDSATVAITTDQTATTALEHQHVNVQWLTCNANLNGAAGATPSAGSTTKQVADVSCQGETKDGKRITVDGKVTQEVQGRCVKGDLTAKVAGRTVFRVSALGNCDAPAPTTGPSAPGPRGNPTVTVTVTVTESFRGK